jgi:hypothetical protein
MEYVLTIELSWVRDTNVPNFYWRNFVAILLKLWSCGATEGTSTGVVF